MKIGIESGKKWIKVLIWYSKEASSPGTCIVCYEKTMQTNYHDIYLLTYQLETILYVVELYIVSWEMILVRSVVSQNLPSTCSFQSGELPFKISKRHTISKSQYFIFIVLCFEFLPFPSSRFKSHRTFHNTVTLFKIRSQKNVLLERVACVNRTAPLTVTNCWAKHLNYS